MESTSPGRSSNSERAPKRRRVAVACRPCRERKSRCDGTQPICALCGQLGTQCSYPPAMSKSDLLRQEFSTVLESLDERMSGFERLLSSVQSRLPKPGDRPSTPAARDLETAASSAPSSDDQITIGEDAFCVSNQPERVDADGIGTVPLASREDCAFFGPSSNISLLRLVCGALVTSTGASQGLRTARNSGDGASRPDPGASTGSRSSHSYPLYPSARDDAQKSGRFTLPSERKTRELIAAFFRNGSQVNPYIHEPRFMETYEEVRRSNFRSIRRSWLALMYMVFALTAFTWPYRSSGLAHLNPESEEWYKLAAELTLTQIFSESGMNVELVQTLMCMVTYLQSTQKPARTWLIHGVAVRAAYQLGLHSADASKTVDSIEREVRKRTWYQLVLTDRTLSMTFGRPPAIHDMQWALGPPQVFEDSAENGILMKEEITLHLMQSSLGLYDIIYKTVNTLYGQNCGIRSTFSLESIAKVYILENDLLEWSHTLPPARKILEDTEYLGPGSTDDNEFETSRLRLRTVITLRYLNARILVHRPTIEAVLQNVIRGDQDSDHCQMLRQAGMNSVNIAITSAKTTLTIIHRRVSSASRGQKLLGAWWFSLYFAFNAALALLGSLLVSYPMKDASGSPARLDHSSTMHALYQSLEILDGLDEGHPTVSHCRTYLQELIRVAEIFIARPSPSLVQDVSGSSTQGQVINGYPARESGHGRDPPISTSVPQLSQITSDFDLENFLFPLDMQMVSGHIAGIDSTFVP